MITVKPVENASTVEFIALEEETVEGKTEILLNGYEAEVLNIEYNTDKPYVLELLLRAALNYSANRNVYIAKTKLDVFTDFPFKKEGEYFKGTIPELLVGSCKS